MRETTEGGAADRPVREKSAQLERQLAAAQQITHIGSFEWDLATNAVTWSDELYRIYGLEPQSCEITLGVFMSKLHPEDRARVESEIDLALTRGGRFAYIERILRPDGNVRHLQTVGEVARDAEGRTLGLIGTCRDVTDQLEREQKIKLYADIVQNIQIGLTVWNVADPGDPPAARLVAFNPAAERAAEAALTPSIGKSMAEILPALAGAELLQMVSTVARMGAVHEVHDVPTSYFVPSHQHARTYSVRAFPLPGSCVGLTLEDVTLQTRARRLQAAEHRVLEMIASGSPLQQALESLIVMIEDQAPSALGSILLLDSSGTRLFHGAAPNLPDEYKRGIDGSEIGPNAGSCGTSAFLQKPVFVSDIETSPLWVDYRELARRFDFRSCWSTPIFASDGRVLGTFALYYREPRTPGRDELELIARATHVAGIGIQRRQLDDQMRELWAHIEAAREDERTEMAREIHDELGQALTALKMDIAWIVRRANAEGSLGRDLLADKLGAVSRMTDGIIDTVRRISADLRPGVLDDLGLVAAIEWQAQEFERRSGITCVVRTSAGDQKFDRSLATAVFRTFQEALTNIARHAEAKHADITLDCVDGQVRLSVQDDGKGIELEAVNSPSSLGLLGIRERVRRLNGRLEVSGEPGRGTRLVVEVPLAAGASR